MSTEYRTYVMLFFMLIAIAIGSYNMGYNNGFNTASGQTIEAQKLSVEALGLTEKYKQSLLKCYKTNSN